MTVYAIGQITIHDRARYNRYAAAFGPVLARFGGRLLAADEHPQVIEGEWAHQKVILLSFEDEARFRDWMTSPEYQEISRDRLAATHGVALLVHGIGAGSTNS